MTAEQARAYVNRWALVAEVERREFARRTPAQKFADIGMLMDVARSLGGATHTAAEIAEVRRRWVLLAERLGG